MYIINNTLIKNVKNVIIGNKFLILSKELLFLNTKLSYDFMIRIIDVLNKNDVTVEHFSEYVDDEKIVVEIGITPNRVDCAGVIGIARDLHASGFGKFKLSKTKDIPIRFQANISVKNLLKNSDCPEFCLRKIKSYI